MRLSDQSETHNPPMSLRGTGLRTPRRPHNGLGDRWMRTNHAVNAVETVDDVSVDTGSIDTGSLRLVPCDSSPQDGFARTWKPRNNWQPGMTESMDIIEHTENAFDHVERQLQNLRALLGMDQPTDGPRAA